MSKPFKVFGIGLNKTGTSTLGQCGQILGYRSTSCDRDLLVELRKGNVQAALDKAAGFDLFEDWPWPLIYRELDQAFPGSKFILTVRKDEQAWLRSLSAHALKTPPVLHCRKLAYGYNYPQGHEAQYLDFYRRHNQGVRSYFQGREDDFIELCWEKGDGWKELCAFLGEPVPEQPFPHAYKGESFQPARKIYWANRIRSWLRV